MRLRFLVTALVGVAFVGCQDQEPLSPGSPQQPVFSAAEATPFVANYASVPIDPGEVYQTGGVLHIRGMVNQGPIWDYITGTVTTVVDIDLVLATGKGTLRASVVIDVAQLDGQGVNGTWEGQAHGHIVHYPGPDALSTGHIVAHGTGDLAGMKIWGDYTNEANPGLPIYVLTGRILDPHGN